MSIMLVVTLVGCSDPDPCEGAGCFSDGGTDATSTSDAMPLDASIQCGDGIVSAEEGCDDGNRRNGDGCSAACQLEPTPDAGVDSSSTRDMQLDFGSDADSVDDAALDAGMPPMDAGMPPMDAAMPDTMPIPTCMPGIPVAETPTVVVGALEQSDPTWTAYRIPTIYSPECGEGDITKKYDVHTFCNMGPARSILARLRITQELAVAELIIFEGEEVSLTSCLAGRSVTAGAGRGAARAMIGAGATFTVLVTSGQAFDPVFEDGLGGYRLEISGD